MAATIHGTKYRPEIDGLRAVAVIAVILYHAGYGWFSGGFVGVDVFFVISGYLITQIILADLQAGRFSLAGFYVRRARRILPALLTVLLAVLCAGWVLMTPTQLSQLSTSAVAVALFASNFYFRATTNYFTGDVAKLPLLHTWSLAVEEQYYILFPLLLAALWRRGSRTLLLVVAAIAVISLVLSELLAGSHPAANFYLLPSRTWELLLGALLAIVSRDRPLFERLPLAAAEAFGAVGLLMIVAAAICYSRATPFPSAYALLPTVGTALVIGLARPATLIARLLSQRILTGLGIISYSAYLWHVPLFAFARIITFGARSVAMFPVLIACTFLLAYLSWRFIENPLRQRGQASHRRVFALAGCCSLCLLGVAAAMPFAAPRSNFTYVTGFNYGLDAACDADASFVPTALCSTSPLPRVILWGDSFAMHNLDGLIGSDSSIALVQATKLRCGPILGLAPMSSIDRFATAGWAADCLRFNRSVLDYVRADSNIDVVIMASGFTSYVDPDEYDMLTEHGRVGGSVTLAADYLTRTIQMLRQAGKRVVIIAPPPAGDFNTGECLEREALGKLVIGVPRNCAIPKSSYLRHYGPVLELLEVVARRSSVPVIRPDSLLCDTERCVATLDGVPLYRDMVHLTRAGSAALGRKLALGNAVEHLAR